MSKYKSTLQHPSHCLAIYNFRFHSYIPRMYTTNVFHSHQKQKNGTQMGQTTNHTTMETHIRPMDPLQQTQARERRVG